MIRRPPTLNASRANCPEPEKGSRITSPGIVKFGNRPEHSCGSVGLGLRLGRDDRQAAALSVQPELDRQVGNLSSSFEIGTDGGDGAMAGPDKRADVAVGKLGAADEFLGNDLPLLLAGQLAAVAVELQAQVAAGAFVGAVNGSDRIGAQAQLAGDGKPLEAVDDLAMLVLDNGRVDSFASDRVHERLPLLWRQRW